MEISTFIIIILLVVVIKQKFALWAIGRFMKEIKKIALKQYNWEIDSDTVDNVIKTIFKKELNTKQ